jgi:hypothetical protein
VPLCRFVNADFAGIREAGCLNLWLRKFASLFPMASRKRDKRCGRCAPGGGGRHEPPTNEAQNDAGIPDYSGFVVGSPVPAAHAPIFIFRDEGAGKVWRRRQRV